MTAEVLPFRPQTLEGSIRAEALRRGISYDDIVIELALEGWRIRQEEQEQFVDAYADETMEIARGDKFLALDLLKRTARRILSGKAGASGTDGPGPEAA